MTAIEITKIVYTDVDHRLIPAATRNVFAHLIDLNERGIVEFKGIISEKSKVLNYKILLICFKVINFSRRSKYLLLYRLIDPA